VRRLRWSSLLSQERLTPSQGGDPWRNEFERDYDRAVFCTPVRRLQDKAQVFPMEEHDAIRTRLTHSLEVSTVARTIARASAVWLAKEKEIECLPQGDQVAQIETIAATCGLIHDLGNPPFGHAGEEAIREWFLNNHGARIKKIRRKQQQCADDFVHFDGNAQTIRLLTRLQMFGDQQGLNLTCATLSSALKYVSPSHETIEARHDASKPGYFASEKAIVEVVGKKTGTEGVRHPITFLVEAADDIVNATVDVEDAIKKGVIKWAEFEAQLRTSKDSQVVKVLKETKKLAKGRQKNPTDETYAQAFRVAAIQVMVGAVLESFRGKYEDIMHGKYHNELLKTSVAGELRGICKTVLKQRVFPSDLILRVEMRGKIVIHDLLDMFWDGAAVCDEKTNKGTEFDGKIYKLVSSNYRHVFHKEKSGSQLPELYHRLQLVTDYLAGMTDTFASTLHKRLRNG